MKNKTLESIAKGTVLGLLGGLSTISVQSQLPDYKAMFSEKQPVQKTWNIPVVKHGNDKAGYFSFGVDIASNGEVSMYDRFERGTDSVLTKRNFETYLQNTEKFRDVTQQVIDEQYK